MMSWSDIYRAIGFSFRSFRVRMGGYLFLTTLLCSVIITLALWLPVYSEYSTAWKENVLSKSEIRKVSLRNELSDAYQLNTKRVSKIEKKLRIRISQAEIINDISRLAQRNGINIVSESYSAGESIEGYELLNQNLVAEGGYSSIRQFLREIDQLAVWTVSQEVRLKNLNAKDKKISARLKLAIYTKAGLI